MTRSIFFKRAITATAVFFGFRKQSRTQSLFSKGFSVNSWINPETTQCRMIISHDNCKTWMSADKVFDLPFNSNITDFASSGTRPEETQARFNEGWMYL